MTRRFFTGTFVLATLALSACQGVGDAPAAQTGEAVEVSSGEGITLPIDTSRSEVSWKAAKVSLAHDGGFRNFDGTVTTDGSTITAVRLNFDMTSIWSDNDRLTGHLKSDDFFNVEVQPNSTFEASQIVPADTAGATHLVTGNLTMNGVTNAVTFPATVNVSEDEVTAQADFIIDRKDWNINYAGAPDDLINDEVRIIFDVVAANASAATLVDSTSVQP